jgi:hypothetical protein
VLPSPAAAAAAVAAAAAAADAAVPLPEAGEAGCEAAVVGALWNGERGPGAGPAAPFVSFAAKPAA